MLKILSHHSGVREAGEIHQLGPRPPDVVLAVCPLTRWPVPRPLASSVVLGLRGMKPKPLLEADAPWSGTYEEPWS